MQTGTVQLDVVVFGGGIAGMWLLDELRRGGYSAVLIEREALGSAQTIGAQGIIHGGLKYTLTGLLTGSAEVIREMPTIWRDCLAGRREPDLSAVTMRSQFCYLWRTDSLASRLGMVGAKAGLRVAPRKISKSDWPELLREVPGDVLVMDEQVLSCRSLMQTLADRNSGLLVKARLGSDSSTLLPSGGVPEGRGGGTAEDSIITTDAAAVSFVNGCVLLTHDSKRCAIQAGAMVLAAGEGNAMLRESLQMIPGAGAMQRRPLHMTMVRFPSADRQLPWFNGHCVDGKKTRVTITSDRDERGRIVWTVGGQVSEEGVPRKQREQCEAVKRELLATIPGLDLHDAQFGTWRVDRAEPKTEGGLRPDDAFAVKEGNVITCWPTKLALAPRLAEKVIGLLPGKRDAISVDWHGWPFPGVARNYWDGYDGWISDL
jgi:glycine/D-amino acid oxidase-like deaminating enzyme